MPEVFLPNQQHCSTKNQRTQCLSTASTKLTTTSTCTAHVNWPYLPNEIWLMILADYGLTSRSLVNLDRTCKWFKCSWGGKDQHHCRRTNNYSCTYLVSTGGSLTEEAARNILKRYKRKRFGALVNRGS